MSDSHRDLRRRIVDAECRINTRLEELRVELAALHSEPPADVLRREREIHHEGTRLYERLGQLRDRYEMLVAYDVQKRLGFPLVHEVES